jgi:hypothetical protein
MTSDTLKDLADKFAEKNPSLLRDLMESHFISFECLEVSQGKCVKCRIKEKNYQDKP